MRKSFSLLLFTTLALSGTAAFAEGVAQDPATTQGLAVVAKAKAAFGSIFAKTSGFPNQSAFEASIAGGPARGADLLKEIQQGDLLEFAIYEKSQYRQSIAAKGILNQHSIGSSGGDYGPEARDRAEAAMLGSDLAAYKKLLPEAKPKSGILQPKVDSSVLRQCFVSYGDDSYILDVAKLKDRLTWTPEDSLNRFTEGASRKQKTAPAWDHFFLPWEDLSLVIPFLMPSLIQDNDFWPEGDPYFFLSHDLDHSTRPEIQALRATVPAQRLKVDTTWRSGLRDYVEGQVWGRVTLDDVTAFQFSTTPPAGPFLDELVRRKIEIRDGRGLISVPAPYGFCPQKPAVWQPGQP